MNENYYLLEVTLAFENGERKILAQYDKYGEKYKREFKEKEKLLEQGNQEEVKGIYERLVLDARIGLNTYKGEAVKEIIRYEAYDGNGDDNPIAFGIEMDREDGLDVSYTNGFGSLSKCKILSRTDVIDIKSRKTTTKLSKDPIVPHERIINYSYTEVMKYTRMLNKIEKERERLVNSLYSDDDSDDDYYDNSELSKQQFREMAEAEENYYDEASRKKEELIEEMPEDIKRALGYSRIQVDGPILDIEYKERKLDVSDKKAEYISSRKPFIMEERINKLSTLRDLEKRIKSTYDRELNLMRLVLDDYEKIKNIEVYRWLDLRDYNQARLALLYKLYNIPFQNIFDPRAVNRVYKYYNKLRNDLNLIKSNNLSTDDLISLMNNGKLVPDGLFNLYKYTYTVFNNYKFRSIEEDNDSRNYYYKMGTVLFIEYDAVELSSEYFSDAMGYDFGIEYYDGNPVPCFSIGGSYVLITDNEKYGLSTIDIINNYSAHVEVDYVNNATAILHVYIDKKENHSVARLDHERSMEKKYLFKLMDDINSYIKDLGLKEIDDEAFRLNPFEIRSNVAKGSFDDYTNESDEGIGIVGDKNTNFIVSKSNGKNKKSYVESSYKIGSTVVDFNNEVGTTCYGNYKGNKYLSGFKVIGLAQQQQYIDPFIDGGDDAPYHKDLLIDEFEDDYDEDNYDESDAELESYEESEESDNTEAYEETTYEGKAEALEEDQETESYEESNDEENESYEEFSDEDEEETESLDEEETEAYEKSYEESSYDDDEDSEELEEEDEESAELEEEEEPKAQIKPQTSYSNTTSKPSSITKKKPVRKYGLGAFFDRRFDALLESHYLMFTALFAVVTLILFIVSLFGKYEYSISYSANGTYDSIVDIYSIFEVSPMVIVMLLLTFIAMIATLLFSNGIMDVVCVGINDVLLLITNIVLYNAMLGKAKLLFDNPAYSVTIASANTPLIACLSIGITLFLSNTVLIGVALYKFFKNGEI